MPVVEGSHTQMPGGRVVRYRAEYEVRERAIHYRAEFDGGASRHEGQFDFDPSKLDAAEAVDAFVRNHVEKADWDKAP